MGSLEFQPLLDISLGQANVVLGIHLPDALLDMLRAELLGNLRQVELEQVVGRQ